MEKSLPKLQKTPFNSSMLSRWISAFGALGLLFSTLYFFGNTGLTILSSLIVLIAAYEYSRLFEKTSLWFIIFLAVDILVYSTHVLKPQYTLSVLMMSFATLISLGIVLFRHNEPKDGLAKIQWTLWGVLYTALLPALSVQILYSQGWPPLLFLLVTVLFGDIFAFFSGLTIGGPKIFPLISPKKTFSGALGGLLGSAVAGTIFLSYFSQMKNLLFMLLLCVSLGAFAQFGDFFESLIKRVAGKKDSGHLMPGHGGFLDRLDGVYLASAVFYFYCQLFDLLPYFSTGSF